MIVCVRVRACVRACVRVRVRRIQYYDYIIYYFRGFDAYIVIDLVYAVCSPLSGKYGATEMTAIIIIKPPHGQPYTVLGGFIYISGV